MPRVGKAPEKLTGQYKHDIPDEYELLIGKIVVAWSRLESAVEELTWAFLKRAPDDGRIITSPLDAKYKISMLRGFGIKIIKGHSLKKFHKAIKLLRNLYDHRNIIAHGNWVTLSNGKFASVSLKRKIPEDIDQMTVDAVSYDSEQLTIILQQCIQLMNYLIELRNQVAN
jgi:hypothetical protein